jgi:hypothetical protein
MKQPPAGFAFGGGPADGPRLLFPCESVASFLATSGSCASRDACTTHGFEQDGRRRRRRRRRYSESERARERESERARERKRERECVCERARFS